MSKPYQPEPQTWGPAPCSGLKSLAFDIACPEFELNEDLYQAPEDDEPEHNETHISPNFVVTISSPDPTMLADIISPGPSCLRMPLKVVGLLSFAQGDDLLGGGISGCIKAAILPSSMTNFKMPLCETTDAAVLTPTLGCAAQAERPSKNSTGIAHRSR